MTFRRSGRTLTAWPTCSGPRAGPEGSSMTDRTDHLARKIHELRDLYAVLETVLRWWGPERIRRLREHVEAAETARAGESEAA